MDVTDELGNVYYKTYYKRAQGLIKKGRARLISENRICLTCPPNNINNYIKSEDIEMLDSSQNIIEYVQDKVNVLYEQYKGAAPGEYDEQVVGGVIAITKCLLETVVKLEALDKLQHLNFEKNDGGQDTGVIRDIYRHILEFYY